MFWFVPFVGKRKRYKWKYIIRVYYSERLFHARLDSSHNLSHAWVDVWSVFVLCACLIDLSVYLWVWRVVQFSFSRRRSLSIRVSFSVVIHMTRMMQLWHNTEMSTDGFIHARDFNSQNINMTSRSLTKWLFEVIDQSVLFSLQLIKSNDKHPSQVMRV